MPPSLCKAPEISISWQYAQYVSRQHQENEVNFKHLDASCQTVPSNHHHTLLSISTRNNAEELSKLNVFQVLSTTQNSHVKLMTFLCPKNLLGVETNKPNTKAILIRGEKMQFLMNKKMTKGVGCNFNCTREYEKHISLGKSGDTETASFTCLDSVTP